MASSDRNVPRPLLISDDTVVPESPFDTQPLSPYPSPDDQPEQLPQQVLSEKPITEQPHPLEGMTMYPPKLLLSSAGSLSLEMSQELGYHRQQLEVTEFLTELMLCFGVFNNACPHDGAGCVTMVATFCGNTCFSCCKVK